MKTFRNRFERERGVGLMEVLITLAVVSVGILAIFVLQGDMINSGSEAKARNEATELAREKIEELRNYIELGQYNSSLTAATANDSKTGINAAYTRNWSITDNPNSDGTLTLKEIAVNVAWTDAKGVSQNVYLTTYVSFTSPIQTVELEKAKDDESDFAPSPNISGIEGAEDGTSGDTRNPQNDTNVGDSGDNDTSDDIYRRTNSRGNLELYTWDGTTAKVVLTVYGGIIHTVKGKVYRMDRTTLTSTQAGALTDPIGSCPATPCDSYTAAQSYFLGIDAQDASRASGYEVNNIDLDATTPSYCLFPINVDLTSSPVSAEYICYYGGDCSLGPAGQNGCPGTINNLPSINGGWYGKIGILQGDPNNPYAICTGDIPDNGSSTKDTPSREYVTLKIQRNSARDNLCTGTGQYFVYPIDNAGYVETRAYCNNNQFYTVIGDQGINQSFECHSFLVNDGTLNASSLSSGCASLEMSNGIYLAPRTIFRTLVAGANPAQENTVPASDDSYCAFVKISGSAIINLQPTGVVGAKPVVTMSGGSCAMETSGGVWQYACIASTAEWLGTLTVRADKTSNLTNTTTSYTCTPYATSATSAQLDPTHTTPYNNNPQTGTAGVYTFAGMPNVSGIGRTYRVLFENKPSNANQVETGATYVGEINCRAP